MKRASLIKLLLLIFAICAFGLGGCNNTVPQNTNSNHAVPSIRKDYFAPSIYSLGTEIYWNACDNAESYDIYEDGKFIENTSKTSFSTENSEIDRRYNVVAKYSSKDSDFSNETKVSKTHGFTDEEILDLSNTVFTEQKITIPSSIRKVIIKKDSEISIHTGGILIENRDCDIVFDLKNVSIYGTSKDINITEVICTENGSIDRVKNNWSLIINVEGKCKIAGENFTSSPTPPTPNSEKSGADGREGVNAIKVTSLVITGNGTLSILGGNGQDGAQGASVFAVGYVNYTYGHGGNGGAGGRAIICKHLLMKMSSGTLILQDGIGGLAGGRGQGGTLRDVIHLSHSAAECDGVSGSSGKSNIQLFFELSGTYNYKESGL